MAQGKSEKKTTNNSQTKKNNEASALEQKLRDMWTEVLGVDDVDLDTDFFALGGDSLSATKISAASQKVFDDSLSISTIFEEKTVSKIAEKLGSNQCKEIPITAFNGKHARLSYQQAQFLFQNDYTQTSAFNVPSLIRLSEYVDTERLSYVFTQFAAIHPLLNCNIVKTDDGQPAMGEGLCEPLSIVQSSTCEESLQKLVTDKISSPFDLYNERPVRLHLIFTEKHRYLLAIFHHIACDGWSLDIWLNYLTNALSPDPISNKEAVSQVNYLDYAYWQKNNKDLFKPHKKYWQSQLQDMQETAFPLDFSRPTEARYEGRAQTLVFDTASSHKLRGFAIKSATSLYTVMLAAFYGLVSRLSGQSDITIGTPSDNRAHSQTQNMMGCFVNSLPLRNQLSEHDTFDSLLSKVKTTLLEAKQHEALPFEEILNLAHHQRHPAKHPLFQLYFTLQHFGCSTHDCEQFQVVKCEHSPALFDLMFMVDDSQPEIALEIHYATHLFRDSTIQQLARRYKNIVEQATQTPSKPVNELTILLPEESSKLIEWSGYRGEACQMNLNRLFEAHVKQAPEKTALRFENTTLTYEELNKSAIRLADAMARQLNAQENTNTIPIVAILYQNSPQMILTMLAAIKAGITYLPLSATSPAERINTILIDAGVSLVVSDESLKEKLSLWQQKQHDGVVYSVNELLEKNATIPRKESNRFACRDATDSVCIFYTSGTTGKPKGVAITHAGISSLVADSHWLNTDEKSTFVQLSDPGFDAAIFEIWGSLLNGCELIIPAKDAPLTPGWLSEAIAQFNISHLWLTKSLFDAFYQANPELFASIHTLIIGGEALTPPFVEQLSYSPACPEHFFNGYGPTESTTFTTIFDCKLFDRVNHTAGVPIGQPISGRTVYVLDKQGQLVPPNTPGELYIGGTGLAKGYLNLIYETQNRFIHPCSALMQHEKRLYRTGDIARWNHAGQLEYLGRADNQIKIRGYRIELQEIEAALLTQEGISQIAVIAESNQDTCHLHAYYVAADDSKVTNNYLRQQAETMLATYMVPTTFTRLDALPTTINGKLDKKKLPKPEMQVRAGYVAPVTPLEHQMCDLWKQLFKCEKVSIRDSFFGLGGDSIQAIRLIGLCENLTAGALTLPI